MAYTNRSAWIVRASYSYFNESDKRDDLHAVAQIRSRLLFGQGHLALTVTKMNQIAGVLRIGLGFLQGRIMPVTPSNLLKKSTLLENVIPLVHSQTRSYKVDVSLQKRCKHCYFVRRGGRLFMECKAKGRHKRMQKMTKNKYKIYFTDDPWWS